MAAMAVPLIISSSINESAPIDSSATTFLVVKPAADYVFSTSPSQSRASQVTNNDDALTIIGGNPFTALECEVFFMF